MQEKELITLVSITSDQAEGIRNKLETEGITCFMKSRHGKSKKLPEDKPVDIRVYMKDLDRALSLISDDEPGKKETHAAQ
jgi:hypothetical protein